MVIDEYVKNQKNATDWMIRNNICDKSELIHTHDNIPYDDGYLYTHRWWTNRWISGEFSRTEDKKTKKLEMPHCCVYAMIADWWAVEMTKGRNFLDFYNWYDEYEKTLYLHPNTRKFIKEIMNKIKNRI